MQEKTKALIAAKDFKAAFRLMQESKYEYIDVLEAGYKNELKVKIFGLYTEDEWQQYEQELQQRLLQIMINGDFLRSDGTPPLKKGPAVFISYSGIDHLVADNIQKYLSNKNISAKIDSLDKSLTQDVYPFIMDQFKISDYVILLISPNSLASGWVGVEHELALFSDQLDMAKYLIVTSDEGRFNNDNNYFIEVSKLIDQKISEINELIAEAEKIGHSINPYRDQFERFSKRRNGLGEVWKRLKARGTAADISGNLFEPGMKRIYEHILADFVKKNKGRN